MTNWKTSVDGWPSKMLEKDESRKNGKGKMLRNSTENYRSME
jgi:hypothetical protein